MDRLSLLSSARVFRGQSRAVGLAAGIAASSEVKATKSLGLVLLATLLATAGEVIE